MQRINLGIILGLGLLACGETGLRGDDSGLAPFDPSNVIYADGCEPLPEARACVEANPRTFHHADAAAASQRCEELGYTCCNPEEWISSAAAACIAETDERLSERYSNTVTMGCTPDVAGPMYKVYENNGVDFIGIGVHAATGRLTWFDDGSGVFS